MWPCRIIVLVTFKMIEISRGCSWDLSSFFCLVYWFCFLQPHPDVRPMAYANPLLSMLSWSCGTRIFYAQLSMLRKRSKYECISVKGHMTFYWPICISQYVYRLVCMFSLPYTSCWRWYLLFFFTKIKGCQIQPCIYSVRSDAFFIALVLLVQCYR